MPSYSAQKSSWLKPNSLLLLILFGGLAFRLYKLGEQSLWYDETVSAFLAGQSIFALIAHTARDIHPPGYYLLLHIWTALAGYTEFALAYLSLIFGIILIALTYKLTRYLAGQHIAVWTACLVAFSPYNIWYSQEVRMYTLGAVLGLAATYSALKALKCIEDNAKTIGYWLSYVLFAALGLYTLYYFAFLLIIINLFLLGYTLRPKVKRASFISLLTANGLLLILYLPWIPIAWKQAANPPVPPWRSPVGVWPVVLESWSALSFGQSADPATIWFFLLLTLTLYILGVYYLLKISSALPYRGLTPWFLLAYTFGPLLLIYALPLITLSPLYHVRYVFIYSPAFYIVLGAGFAGLATRTRLWVALMSMVLILGVSIYSLYQYHFNPRYQADDFRGAVAFIQNHWQPGDVMMTNAGYTYPAFVYYADFPNLQRRRLSPYRPPADFNQPYLLQTGTINGNPQLGWGDPQSDFYAMSIDETISALEKISTNHHRLWLLRAYDTVTDPDGIIRAWLDTNTTPIEDEPFSGESNIRAQGFLLTKQPELQGETVQFADGVSLTGWTLPQQIWQPGQTIPIQLGWLNTARPTVDYKMSLKLWNEHGELTWQGEDTWPVGRLFRTTDWPVGQTIIQPASLTLPADIPPGQYWLNVELYHPDTIQPLSRLDGEDPVVTLGPVGVQ